jgi:hypothetical protein
MTTPVESAEANIFSSAAKPTSVTALECPCRVLTGDDA